MFKKILSIFLVCLMCLSLSVPFAFAAPSGVVLPDGLSWSDNIVIMREKDKYTLFDHVNGTMYRQNQTWLDVTDAPSTKCYRSDSLSGPWTSVTCSREGYNGRVYFKWSINANTANYDPETIYSPYVMYDTSGRVFSYPTLTPALPVEPSDGSYALFYGSDNYLYFYDNYEPYNDRVDLVDNMYIVTYTVDVAPDVYRYKDGAWETVTSAAGVGYLNIAGASAIVHYPNKLTFEGSDFFTPPLTLAAAIQGGLESLMIAIMKAVLILVGLGVSLMASLIGLSLLKRLLLGFLN